MILYSADQHETLLVAWFYQLQSDPEEHANLFMEPLRHLTAFLNWAANQVRMMLTWDTKGLWGAAWVEPLMSAAFFGLWIRKDMRGTPAAVAFVNRCYDQSLEHFPTLIGITKQPRLHAIHLRMGYRYVGEIEHCFDDATARVYSMTKESRNGRRRKDQHIEDEQPLRAAVGGVRGGGPASVPELRPAGDGSPENGGRERADSDSGKKHRRRKVGPKFVNGADAAEPGAERVGE